MAKPTLRSVGPRFYAKQNKPIRSRAFTITIIAALILLLMPKGIVHSIAPMIYIDPAYREVQVNQEFDVNVNVDYVTDLYGYEIRLSFDSTKLEAYIPQYRGFLNEPTTFWNKEVNNATGFVILAVTSQKPAASKTGASPPPLLTVRFKSLALGNSALHLYDTKLASGNEGIPITHTTADGVVSVVPSIGHDIAVSNLISAKTVICRGFSGNISVTVQNYGSFIEVFNVTLFANSTLIHQETISLSIGSSSTLSIVWNTSSFEENSYVLNASAESVPGEVNISNNNFTDGLTKITMMGDVVPDGLVDIFDIVTVAVCFGANIGDSGWNANADINNDGTVDIFDIVVVALHFGEIG